VDTSRNGRGPAPGGAWCNPPGRGLGTPPTAATGNAEVDAYLWVKHPGQSDGTCNGGPAAGGWWASYALELAVDASF
jgi:endoglucanase